ncbi:MAG: aminotransferase class I/II-fold pyridoxal phosphate-dependent enzyme, partial [Rhodobacteraceae bacterium]|nr:aminotransferase class I/II-fold pyridoxal phosphate-dependent enzyme [Paracoccaceae bacterium]
MFEKLFSAAPDEILELMQAFRSDPRPNKIDLGVGVYKDHNGYTPIMKAIKIAEKKLWASESTKSYVGLTGDVEFHQVMIDLILGDTIIPQRIAAAATPGGTGALRQGLELIKIANPRATIWLSDPTWPNHPSIAEHLELKVAKYRYFNKLSQSVSFDEMLVDLSNAKE